MARRPPLTDSTFLGFIFHPKTQAQPVGLRRKTLTGTVGRNKRRLTRYNNMSAAQQAILDRSGSRELYLRGETTLAAAKDKLREQAVSLGVAKPKRTRGPITQPQTSLQRQIQRHLRITITNEGKRFNQRTSDKEIAYLYDPDMGMLQMDYADIKHAGRRGSEHEVVIAGVTHNPFWYH